MFLATLNVLISTLFSIGLAVGLVAGWFDLVYKKRHAEELHRLKAEAHQMNEKMEAELAALEAERIRGASRS